MTDKKKIYKRKRFYFTMFVILALSAIIAKKIFLPADNSHYKDFDEIKKRGTLVIAVQNNPMSMYINGNDTSGYAYSIIKDFAKEKNLKLEIKVKNSLEKEIRTMNFGGCNIIADIIPQTMETKNKIRLSTPLMKSYSVLIQNRNSSRLITRHQQIAKRTVTIPKDSPYKSRIKNLEKEINDSIFIEESGSMNILDIVKTMETEKDMIAVCGKYQAENLKKDYPYITAMKIGFDQNCSIGTDKSANALADTINTWLKDYMKSESFIKLQKEYSIK